MRDEKEWIMDYIYVVWIYLSFYRVKIGRHKITRVNGNFISHLSFNFYDLYEHTVYNTMKVNFFYFHQFFSINFISIRLLFLE